MLKRNTLINQGFKNLLRFFCYIYFKESAIDLKNIIFITGLVISLSFLVWFLLSNSQNQIPSIDEITRLERMGDECVGISEKAIVGMTPVVEFQKLELLSRKANVLKNCMADRGFRENPDWREYAKPLAEESATQQNISFDEAIETMRKDDMLFFKNQDRRTLYWTSTLN